MKQTSEVSRYSINAGLFKNYLNLLSAAVVILLGLSLWLGLGKSLPKKKSELTRLLDVLNNGSAKEKIESIDRLAAMGSDAREALPQLVNFAVNQKYNRDRIPDSKLTRAIEKIDLDATILLLEEKLFSDDTKWIAASLIEKYSQHSVANEVVPSLVKGMREIVHAQTQSEQLACFQCADALGRIEPKGVLTLKREMFHPQESVRIAAVRGVPSGKAGKTFVLRLTLRLFDSSLTVRSLTVESLSNIGRYATDALTALKQRLSMERDPIIRRNIIRTIKKISAQHPT